VPVGCFSSLDAHTFSISAFVASVDGQTYLREDLSGRPADSENMAHEIAEKLLAKGAKAILDDIRKSNS
jgi:hydroxymethylbilane synthase